MEKFRQNKKGQFIIIAVLMVAIMIISLGALMHTAVTYYKHEPWEEYSTLIGDIELNSRRLLELSLVNFTHTSDFDVLKNNVEQWQQNLANVYVGGGVSLDFMLTQGATTINGVSLNFANGLAYEWNRTVSTSAAQAEFVLNISSIGLTGYRFSATAFLNLRIVDSSTEGKITVAVKEENNDVVTNLKSANFRVNSSPVFNISSSYHSTYYLVYNMDYEGSTPPLIELWDHRGIRVVAKPG